MYYTSTSGQVSCLCTVSLNQFLVSVLYLWTSLLSLYCISESVSCLYTVFEPFSCQCTISLNQSLANVRYLWTSLLSQFCFSEPDFCLCTVSLNQISVSVLYLLTRFLSLYCISCVPYHQDGGGGPVGVWGARLLVLSHVLCWVSKTFKKERKKESTLRVDVRAPLPLVFLP